MRRAASTLALVVLLVGAGGSASAAAAAKPAPSADGRIVVRLAEGVSLPALRIVSLGQVAEVEGGDAVEAANVSLGAGPPPGRKRGITRAAIMTALLRQGFRRDAIRFAGPNRVVVTGAGQSIDRRRVDAAVAEWLERVQAAELPEHSEVRLGAVKVPSLVRISTGVYRVEVEGTEPLRSGTNRLSLVVRVDGVPDRRVPITADVTIDGPVVVLLRDVPAGARIAAEDLALETRAWPRFGKGIANPQDAIGRVARRGLRVGDVLTDREIGPNWAVTAGEPVEAVFRRGAVRLAFETTARANGEIGAIVPVNGASGTLVRARVLAPGRVVLLGSEEIARSTGATGTDTETDR